MDLTLLVLTAIKVVAIAGLVIAMVPVMTWVERRGAGFIQLRLGPNRVGPLGLFQPLADGLKFLFKEDIVPPFAHRGTYILAPGVALCAAVLAFAVIPVGGQLSFLGRKIPLVIADVDAGVLLLLAASGMGVYGIIMAGWASNNKYSQMGGLRSSSQMISYELALGLAVISVLVIGGTLRPVSIVQQQAGPWGWFPLGWNVFKLPLGFVVMLVAGFAETNRAPFDLPEAETELVAGSHVEYSSMKFAMFFMAEYANMVTVACLATLLFFGGWLGPVFGHGLLPMVLPIFWFCLKVFFFMFLYVWVRWTLPRFRYDQLMAFGWRAMLPLTLANIVGTGLLGLMTGPRG